MATLECKYPEWFDRLLKTPAKIVLCHSGRGGGGKTTALAKYAIDYALCSGGRRVVMGREIMRSSKESNIKSVRDWLAHPDMLVKPKHYTMTANEINFWNGSQILFMGLSSSHGTSQAFPSTTGVNLLIVDEAQSLTRDTCQRVFPTIRERGSKIVLAYNPINPTDAVERFRRLAKDTGKNHYKDEKTGKELPYICDIALTWQDNQWFKETDLYPKMLFDKANSPDEYRHIWLGEYQSDEGYRIAHYVDAIRCFRDWDDETLKRGRGDALPAFGLDLALSDKGDNTTLVIAVGGVIERVEAYTKGTSFGATVHNLLQHDLPEYIHYDATGIGGGFIDVAMGRSVDLAEACHPIMFGSAPRGRKTLWEGNINNASFFSSRRDQMYFAIKNRIANTLDLIDKKRDVDPADCLLLSPKFMTRTQAEELAGQIAQPTYTFSTRGHVRFDKTPAGEDSPDLLDALALAYAIDSEAGIQNSRYRDDETIGGDSIKLLDPITDLRREYNL